MGRIFFTFDELTGAITTESRGKIETTVAHRDDEDIRPGRPRKYDPICGVDGCNKPHRAKGLCGMHYERRRRNGDEKIKKRSYGKRARQPWDVKKMRDKEEERNKVMKKAVKDGVMTAEEVKKKHGISV